MAARAIGRQDPDEFGEPHAGSVLLDQTGSPEPAAPLAQPASDIDHAVISQIGERCCAGAARLFRIGFAHHIGSMPEFDDEARAELVRLLRTTIDADRFPLSPRIQALKRALDAFDPQPERTPFPAPSAGTPSGVMRKKLGRGRR